MNVPQLLHAYAEEVVSGRTLSNRSARAWSLHGGCWNSSAVFTCVRSVLVPARLSCGEQGVQVSMSVSFGTHCVQLFKVQRKANARAAVASEMPSAAVPWRFQACDGSQVRSRPLENQQNSTSSDSCAAEVLLLGTAGVHPCSLGICCSQEAKPTGRSIFRAISPRIQQTEGEAYWLSVMCFLWLPFFEGRSHICLLISNSAVTPEWLQESVFLSFCVSWRLFCVVSCSKEIAKFSPSPPIEKNQTHHNPACKHSRVGRTRGPVLSTWSKPSWKADA